MDGTDLCFTPATELRRLIRARQLSPVELTDAVLSRIERLNPVLNAFLTVTADAARREAKAAEARARGDGAAGPLDGVPYSIKDLEPTAGVRTTYGSKFFEHNVPAEDGLVASRLRASGGILLGKTNTPHFGHRDMCDNLLGPPCRNPWKLDRTSGGSSGGAGAAVAAGLGPLAHGSDGAGSIRIPSALCGVVGFKPSFGRIPYHPNADYWSARSHNGPMAGSAGVPQDHLGGGRGVAVRRPRDRAAGLGRALAHADVPQRRPAQRHRLRKGARRPQHLLPGCARVLRDLRPAAHAPDAGDRLVR